MNDNDADVMELPAITNMDVVKLNITDAEIARLKEEYLPLVINDIEDKIGLAKVYAARQDVKKKRVALVRYASGLKEKALAWQRKVNEEQNRVVKEFEAIEQHLQAEEDKVQKEKDRIAAEKEKAAQEVLQTRVTKLAAYGYTVDLVLLRSITDQQFELTLANAKSEYEKELARKAEEERLQKLEQERLIAERKELEDLREKQREQQKIIDKQNEEQENQRNELRRQKINARCQQLIALGMRLDKINMIYAFEDVTADIEEITQMNDAEFVSFVIDISAVINKRKAATEKRLEEAMQESFRLLEKAKKDAADKALQDKKDAEIKAKFDAEERLAQSSDRVKFKNIIEQLQAITIPEMKSIKSKGLAKGITEMISKTIDHINAEFLNK